MTELIDGSPKEAVLRQTKDRLLRGNFYSVIISKHRDVPEIVGGFIFNKLGIITGDQLYNPETWYSKEINAFKEGRSLVLFDPAVLNPQMLAEMVLESDLPKGAREQLFFLSNFLQHYRGLTGGKFVEARDRILKNGKPQELMLSDFLAKVIQVNFFPDPQVAFRNGVQALDRLFCRDEGFDLSGFSKTSLEVPILKGVESSKPDVVDRTTFTFDRTRILYLKNEHIPIVIGGVPNSGKSTLTVSLCEAMNSLITECECDGILGDREVTVWMCDLDRFSPTTRSIEMGTRPFRGMSREWAGRAAEDLSKTFELMTNQYNIVLGDLPGGAPDEITGILSKRARHSIMVNRVGSDGAEEWNDFFTSLDKHGKLIQVDTILGEEGRISGVRQFAQAHSDRRKRDLLWGRAVDLDRRPKPSDDFIVTAAHALLFSYLPQVVIDEYDEFLHLHQSLGEVVSHKNKCP